MNKYLLKTLLATVMVSISPISFSEDIDLYISDIVKEANKTTKVLIVFDTSGSMGFKHTVKVAYDPAQDYTATETDQGYDNNTIYYDDGTGIPEDKDDARKFLANINGCESSKISLAEKGFYIGRVREYTGANDLSWRQIRSSNNSNEINLIDCEKDAYVLDNDGAIANLGSRINADGLPNGYPRNGDGSGTQVPNEHHDDSLNAESTNIDWASGNEITLYTGKYLRWHHNQNVKTVTETRLLTAQRSIREVINSAESVDFGLELFNFNYNGGDAGRVVQGIVEMDEANKTSLISKIDAIHANGSTPLCESVFEASQYFAGAPVVYGNGDRDYSNYDYIKNIPAPDPNVTTTSSADDGSVIRYNTPFMDCGSSIAHIILITDGTPQYDNDADGYIEGLTSERLRVDAEGEPILDAEGNFIYDPIAFKTNYKSTFPSGNVSEDKSYLPALAGWMSENDINPNLAGKQTVITHTIGFSSGAEGARGLLDETARRSGGKSLMATSGADLTAALQNILLELPTSNDTLTSASVAANNFDRTQTLDYVYYAMFEPQAGPRWQGNLKKYKVVDGNLIGINGADASCTINSRSTFCEDAQSYWSADVDGNIVDEGGVVGWFKSREPRDRKLYMNKGDGAGALIDFNLTNLNTAFTNPSTGQVELASALGVAGLLDSDGNSIEDTAVLEMLAWASGADIDDDNNNGKRGDMRKDVFGDPLHSKPVVINYGANTGSSNIRIVVGTNSGALHMFQDFGESVQESWAFMPTEFIDNIKTLRNNQVVSDKVYGVDGEITVYQNDINGNGIIDKGSDKVWIFFGLRRGGSSYYAVDITDPDSPNLMWRIDSKSDGFSELGQSWSQPKVGYSLLNVSGDTASPVLFIGGGYDVNKDGAGAGTPDDKGRAIYMLDAETGQILWNAAPEYGSTPFPGDDSIPSAIGLFDSTGNGLTDRVYTGDTGGNIWRIDMPGKDISEFSVSKLASLGGGTDDQRFFYEPTIVKTFISEIIETTVTDDAGVKSIINVHQETPYDAVLIGSGDRSNPLGTLTTDTLYMIKDNNILTQNFPTAGNEGSLNTISKDDLYNYTDNPFDKPMTTQEEEDLRVKVSKKSGWYKDLLEAGEKSTSQPLVINGAVYFTTYTPAKNSTIVQCRPPEGRGAIHVLDLALGIKRHDSVKDVRDSDNTVIEIGTSFLDTPTIVVLPDPDDPNKDITTYFTDKEGKPLPPIFTTSRSFIHSTEN